MVFGRSYVSWFFVGLVLTFAAGTTVLAEGRFAPAGAFDVAEPPFVSTPIPTLPYGAQVQDQSAFALGSITWNVVFVQGNGSIDTQLETWTTAELNKIKTKIGEAKSYWEGLTSGLQANTQLSINVKYANNGFPVVTGHEPSKDKSEDWINSVMNQLGYNSANRFTTVA